MSRLVLHIGTHKTGTTTVQNTLFANRALLARHGIVYPDIGRVPGHHGLVLGWADQAPPINRLPGGPEKAWKDLAENYAAGDRTLFLSSEEFSRGHPSLRVDFRKIRDYAKDFDEVQVICVLRNQLTFLQSIYLEVSKKRSPPQWGKFFKQSMSKNFGAGLFLDYNDLYDHLLDAFAPAEIRFLSYEETHAAPGGVLGHILALLDPDLALDALHPVGEGPANVSPEPLASWVASKIAAPEAAPAALVTLAADLLARDFGAETRTTLYTKAEARQLEAHFAPLNARLRARVPELGEAALHIATPTSDLLYRNAITAEIWTHAAEALYRCKGIP